MLSRRKILKILAGLFALLIAALLVAWLLPQQVLTVDSGPVTAEVLVVLGGGYLERPDRAAELFQQGEAPRIICSGDGDCKSNRARLVKQGVPAAVIQTECDSRNTQENAELTIKLLRAQGVKRAIIVTTWFHSRRALNCFEHYAPEIEFYSRPSYAGYSGKDWKLRGVARNVKSEYLKLAGYFVRYGVWPF
jgi:uncharacterized SAM-binding protein YcdF (DUF218 family)